MIEHIPQPVDNAFLYFHSAGKSSAEIDPFLPHLVESLPHTYIWAGDGVISKSPLMRQGLFYGEDTRHYNLNSAMVNEAINIMKNLQAQAG